MNKYTAIALVSIILLMEEAYSQILEFQSPNKAIKVSIDKGNKLGTDWNKEGFREFLSISLSREKLPLLWVGIAYQDESGTSPEVIWSRSSETALLLFRPQRGEVVLGVFRPNSTTKYESVLSDQELKKFSHGMNNDPTSLQKIWTENWKEVNDCIYEGDLVIATTTSRKIHIQLITSKLPSVISILKQQDN